MKTLMLTALFMFAFAPLARAENELVQWKSNESKIQVLADASGGFRVKGGKFEHARLEKTVDGYRLSDGAKPVKTAHAASADKWTISSGDALADTLAFKGDEARLTSSEGALLWRVKIKDDKFNLYDAKGERIAHGKAKPDGHSVKTETKDEETQKIKGAKSLREAALLALPVADDERILFWSLERKP